MTSRSSVFKLRDAAAAALAVSLLLTTACNSGEPPPGNPPAPALPSASAVATPTATLAPAAGYKPADALGKAQNVPVPVLPEVAKAETKEGLEAFARYWFAQLNFAYETGQIDGLTSVTAPDCQFCTNVTGALVTNYAGGRWLAGGRIEIPSISSIYKPQTDGEYQVVVQVQQAGITYLNLGGSQFRAPTPPSDTGNVVLAAFRNGQWQLTGLHPIR